MSLVDDVLLFFNTEVDCEESLYLAGVQYFDLIARFPPVAFNEDFSVRCWRNQCWVKMMEVIDVVRKIPSLVVIFPR